MGRKSTTIALSNEDRDYLESGTDRKSCQDPSLKSGGNQHRRYS